jgi:hypothetical protein
LHTLAAQAVLELAKMRVHPVRAGAVVAVVAVTGTVSRLMRFLTHKAMFDTGGNYAFPLKKKVQS